MAVSAKEIAALRLKTGLPMMECKSALIEADGNEQEAIKILKSRGLAKVAKRSERETKSGLIEGYVHDGKIGILVEVLTETDFVAKNSDFKEFVHNLALQIAATNPKYISKDDVPVEVLQKEKDELETQVKASGKPEKIVQKILEGKINSFYSESCLLEQPYIKDQNKNVGDLLIDLVSKIGEKILISRFIRYELGN